MENTADTRPWYRQLTGYHWFVFVVASAAWFFDCLDQRLFSLARVPAMESLVSEASADRIPALAKNVTAIFLIGWGVGGVLFGAFGDRFGRAKMLTLTILLYSGFTGLTFFSRGYWDFALYRFLTGMGVGGVFGLAVALIAETVPSGARVGALGMLQTLSAIGNITSSGCKWLVDAAQRNDIIAQGTNWRWMFLFGAVPAVLIIFTSKWLREPEPWLKQKAAGKLPKGAILAPYAGLLREAQWRKNLIIGALLASTGVIGLWAIGEYAVDLQRFVFRNHFSTEKGLTDAKQIKDAVDSALTTSFLLQQIGAGVGMWLFTIVAMRLGRRSTFAIGYASALIVTFMVYWKMNSPSDAYWMMPLMGAAQLSVFAGFAIYLPELFPSRLRSTGTSFCYNLGRFAAAGGSYFSAELANQAFGQFGSPLKERYAAMAMCSIFLVGLVTLLFAPETKDQPLPE
ncbi:MAG: MFS transporter [Pirellulales bacterium]|nr:MFS transporter [Pirellulales bacterium]